MLGQRPGQPADSCGGWHKATAVTGGSAWAPLSCWGPTGAEQTEIVDVYNVIALQSACLNESSSQVTIAVTRAVLAHGCQVTHTPPSTTSLNQNPQRNKATVCYICTPSPFHCCLSSSTKRSAGCLSPLNQMISPRGGRSCRFCLSRATHTYTAVGIQTRNYNLCPEVTGKVTLLLRDLQAQQNETFSCVSGRHSNALDSGEMQTPPSPIRTEPLCS